MNSEVLAHAFIMETYLRRENVNYRRIDSKTSSSVYFEIIGPRSRGYLRTARLVYRLRISDHAENSERDQFRRADFHIRSAADIRAAQTSIEARVIRPTRAFIKGF